MLKKSKRDRALLDVRNVLFESGILDTPTDMLDPRDELRNKLGIDSQELVGLAVGLSSLATSSKQLDETTMRVVDDLVEYVATNRDTWLPTDVPYVLQSSITINQNREWVQSCIAEYHKWPKILAHVKKIEPEYDDGCFQSFKMYIEELTTLDNYFVQSLRYVNCEAGIIDFTQPKPPSGFRIHKGGWRFKKLRSNVTSLIAYHGFELDENADVADSIALIRKHIQAALKTWADYGNKQ